MNLGFAEGGRDQERPRRGESKAFRGPTSPDVWHPPHPSAMLRWPTPEMGFRDRLLFRSLAALAVRQVRVVTGIDNLAPEHDPFILAANHNTKRESVLVPSLFFVVRGGRLIHFLSDWNYRIVPGIGFIFRRGQVITIARKDARPKFLNVLRRFYEHPVPAMERARVQLLAGRSVGFFPEGTINRDPRRLLVGRVGMARLSLETGVPVVPVGIRFPGIDLDRPTPENAAMEVHIGAPLYPARASGPPSAAQVRRWHTVVMGEIARLSGKSWGR